MHPSPYPLPTHLPMGMGGYWVPMGMGTHCRTLVPSHFKELIRIPLISLAKENIVMVGAKLWIF